MGNPPAANFHATAVWWWTCVLTEPCVPTRCRNPFSRNKIGKLTFWIALVHAYVAPVPWSGINLAMHICMQEKILMKWRLTSSGIDTIVSKENITWILGLNNSRWKEHVPPKCQFLCTWLHGIISQKATFTASATISQTVMWCGKWCGFHYFTVMCPNVCILVRRTLPNCALDLLIKRHCSVHTVCTYWHQMVFIMAGDKKFQNE